MFKSGARAGGGGGGARTRARITTKGAIDDDGNKKTRIGWLD